MKKLLYFAYGSNLLSSRLAARIGHAEYLENYLLKDYKLTFDCQGFANIQPSIGSVVEGALYHVNSLQLLELNRYEGLYTPEYFDYDKDTIACVYIGLPRAVNDSVRRNVKPLRKYLTLITEGCKEKGLKTTYDFLMKNKSKIAPLRSKSSRNDYFNYY